MNTFSIPSFKQFLEARKNPELNPKISAYEALLPYKDDDSIYISMVDDLSKEDVKSKNSLKIGINPNSEWRTPIGIYTYPLKDIWKEYNLDRYKRVSKILPFASENPYIYILKSNDVTSMEKFNAADSDKANIILKRIWNDEGINRYYDWDRFYNFACRTAKPIVNPMTCFWNATRIMSLFLGNYVDYKMENEDVEDEIKLNDDLGNINTIVKWNWILRECGFKAFKDSGRGIIHQNEPIQTVFLSKMAFEIVDVIRNKNYGIMSTVSHVSDLVKMNEDGIVGIKELLMILLDRSGYNYEIQVQADTLVQQLTFEQIKNIIMKAYTVYLKNGDVSIQKMVSQLSYKLPYDSYKKPDAFVLLTLIKRFESKDFKG